ncbi:hypothetical protein H6G20_25960 [Desertifilum sp. FACHB-1129]|uniref:Uncharacterized protein n=2 Tax=Desertifilum tharense IPPAS B-1220 TaxID=1781255 RepID=A0A1E5QHC4_9CYAN|nr:MULTISPECIES: hypothetical protein [Desertifilum]MCD8489525.1 hypothetical protein [Desertifilum sp.]MDA0209423.1 hypothetical protein [Cyanobacteria bacterium FC1]NES95273.1 hypothetical protein [Desertifilum sp. SIO1I2]MBD2315117.1 hypothetical protein [Desertifilum sp. FACHB-1129]MBD2324579.1 hypothetical protein [Desertifilum sp. FACHB-866]
MNYPIPKSPQEIAALQDQTVDEELVAAAIAGVIQVSRSQGRSLEELKAEVLEDDGLLDIDQRCWLSSILAQAWDSL